MATIPGSRQDRTRGEQILGAAIESFGRQGVAGSSLRDIARDAGVSLTLIAHHFGSKRGLVGHALLSLEALAAEPVTDLRIALEQSGRIDLRTVVRAWVQYALDLFGRRSRLPYLRLFLRLRTDPAVGAETAGGMDAAEPYVRRALHRLFPDAPHDALELAWHASSGALHAALLNDHELSRSSPAQWEQRATLEGFLTAGLLAALSVRAGTAEAAGSAGRIDG